ncbi:MAG: MFS transporter [Candidatus Omnitrophica bacterium]|nr:MFS transporter [Candidatus Omnitrophota bacterium]
MFSSLTIKNFRLYWTGMFISLVGTWIQVTAQSWLVFELTHSAFLLGVVAFLNSIPIFAFSLFGGVAADRLEKKRILLYTQSAFMVLAFILAVLTHLNRVSVWQIMLIVLLNGTVMAFDAPTRQSMVIELVGRKKLLNAIALNYASFNLSRIIGPMLAGILIAAIGMSGCFYLNGVSFLAVIIALLLIRLNGHPQRGEKGAFWQDLHAGIVFVRSHQRVLALLFIAGIASLFSVSYTVLMPIFAGDILRVGVRGLGILMASAGAGAVIAALMVASGGRFRHKGKMLIVSSFIFSVSLTVFGLSRSYALSLASAAFLGWSSISALSLINTSLQEIVPDEFRGRLMSVFMSVSAGFVPLGNLIAGSLTHLWGAPLVVALSGVFCTVFFIFINLLYPGLKEIQ